ncbi:Mbov_0401 family ICE element transposase-like protein [Mycoplasmopsis primatum]|uniref:Mbov_0401 family ICE element transposase-like protein n=1 Tax=Mycoplasmopsis primatum TaxID=55604 RepID=UPI000495CDCD|nr:hypothetical protein [Mycoplasmopsis primatum]
MQSNELANAIFNSNYQYELYKEMAEKINHIEWYFRTIIRKRLYSDWKVFRRKTRQWITRAGVFYLNVTEYEKWDPETQKLIRFVYYHHPIVENLKYSKYDFELIKEVILDYLNGNKRNNYPDYYPSKQMVSYFKERFKINEHIKNLNDKLLDDIYNNSNNCKYSLNMDDLFKYFQMGNTNEKVRIREAVFHKENDINKGGICLFFVKPVNAKNDENNNLNYQVKEIENVVNSLNLSAENITLNGDGAPWMKRIQKELNVNYVLDNFHIKKMINMTFGHNRFAIKDNKKVFKNWKSIKFNKTWCSLFNEVFNDKKYNDFLDVQNEFLKELSLKNVNNVVLNNIEKFFNYINMHKKMIWNSAGDLLKNKSYTEHFVYHFFKKHISKYHSLYSLKNIETIIIYQNLMKKYATIFR